MMSRMGETRACLTTEMMEHSQASGETWKMKMKKTMRRQKGKIRRPGNMKK